MSGIYKEGYFFGDNGNGHNIKSEGTDQYPRESLNFSGFDLADDPTNDETDVKAHRLSSSELDEILSDPIPPKPTELPVLFDETGSERIVGWYKLANGTKKPVYEKNIILNSRTFVSTEGTEVYTDSSIESLVDCDAYDTNSDGETNMKMVLNCLGLVNTNGKILLIYQGVSSQAIKVKMIIIRNTKSTDNPQ